MKILFVSTLKRAVSPKIFASRSRIIYQLAEGLQKRGHTIALLGTGDSFIPGVKIIPVIDKAWNELPAVENPFLSQVAILMRQAQQMVSLQKEYDIIHNHTYPDFFPHILEDKLKIPLLTTMHAVADYYIEDLLSNFRNSHFTALSKAYTKYFKKDYFHKVIYNGVDTDTYALSEKKEDYMFWLGRLPKGKNQDGTFIDPKGVRQAIELAKKTGKKLLLAGAVEDAEFFRKDVEPFLNENIKWVGEVSEEQSLTVEQVISLLQGAKVFLMTVNQDEPYGLVMAEAMACGTPVIGYARGSVGEIVEDGKTGFIVNPSGKDKRGNWITQKTGVQGLADAVEHIYSMKKKEYKKMQKSCRARVEKYFTIERMVNEYELLYTELIKKNNLT